jgi:hypothetical protein
MSIRSKLKTLRNHFRPEKIIKICYSVDEIGDDVDEPNVIYVLINV